MNKGLIPGGENTSHKSGNDILYTVVETGQNVLIEGDEYHLCKSCFENNEIYEYKNKTNKEILDDIYTKFGCKVEVGKANIGDFIVCKLAVRDTKKRNLTGTIAEIISKIQSEHGCRVYENYSNSNTMSKGGNVKKGLVYEKKIYEITLEQSEYSETIHTFNNLNDALEYFNLMTEGNFSYSNLDEYINPIISLIEHSYTLKLNKEDIQYFKDEINIIDKLDLDILKNYGFEIINNNSVVIETKTLKSKHNLDFEIGLKIDDFKKDVQKEFYQKYKEYIHSVNYSHNSSYYFLLSDLKDLVKFDNKNKLFEIEHYFDGNDTYYRYILHDEKLNLIQIRISDHSQNINNINELVNCSLSIVITSNNQTFNKFKNETENHKEIIYENQVLDYFNEDLKNKILNNIEYFIQSSVGKISPELKKGGKILSANEWIVPSKDIYEYADFIRKKYPILWDKAGNIYGNEAFKNLAKVVKRGYWKEEEAWMYKKWRSFVARHKNDYLIQGVIANLKWLNYVSKGEKYVKNLINKEIEKLKLEYSGNLHENANNNKQNEFEDSLKHLVGSAIFNGKFKERFKFKNNIYWINFLIAKYDGVPYEVDMIINKGDKIVLTIPFDFELFDFDYEPFFKKFGRIKQYGEGGLVELNVEVDYPQFYLPNSYFIPEQVKNEANNKKIPKKKYDIPFDFSLEEAEKITKNFRDIKLKYYGGLNSIFLLGDVLGVSDSYKLAFIGIKEKKYGYHKFDDFNLDTNFTEVKNNDHPFFGVIKDVNDIEKNKSVVDLKKIYKYLNFLIENKIIEFDYYTIPLYYNTKNNEEVVFLNANHLKQICDLYFLFGINKVFVYITNGIKKVFFTYKEIDEKVDIIKQLENNICVLMMPLKMPINDKSSNLKIFNNINILSKYNISKNEHRSFSDKVDELWNTKSLLTKSDFQFDYNSFKKKLNVVVRLYGKKAITIKNLIKILDNFADEKNLNKKYSEMTEKELKLAYSILWIKLWLDELKIE